MLKVLPGIKGLIFDCDGTLADTMPIHIGAWQEIFRSKGFDCPHEFIDSIKGTPSEHIVAKFNREFGSDLDPKAITEEKDRLTYEQLLASKPIGPVVSIADEYRGILPMAVASGGTRENVIITLRAIGLLEYFQTVITADDGISPKPDPDIFLEAAKGINVEPRFCEVFEDGDVGLEAARRAGMVAVDVRRYL